MSQADWRRREELFRQAFDVSAECSPSTLLSRVLGLAKEIAGADYGTLILVDPDGEVTDSVACDAAQDERWLDLVAVDAGVVGRVASEGETIRLAHVGDDPGLVGFPQGGEASPFLGVPLSLWGKVYGAICLGRREGAPSFDEADEHAMVRLGAEAGVALDHARLLQQAGLRERTLVALKDVSHAILEGLETDEVLRLVARSACDLAGASMAFVNAPDLSGEWLVLRAAAGERAEATVGMTFPANESISGEVMRSGLPLLVEDASSDPRVYQPVVRMGHVGPVLFVPLAVGERVFGTLSVANEPGGRRLSSDDVLLLQAFAAEAAVALQYGQIRTELERLTLLDERERIAMDLHDGVIQALFVVGLSLQAAQEVASDPEEVSVRLADAVGSIDGAIRDLRDYIFGLQPGESAQHELERALRDVAAVFERSGLVSTAVEVEVKAASVMASHVSALTHIAREAMSNAVRHSGAGFVSLKLRLRDSKALLEVCDNGCGFDPERAEGTGNGLVNLRARAKSLGGRLEIDSRPGGGSIVRVCVPV